LDDSVLQEMSRVVVAIQCFAVGIQLPRHYFRKHWRSVAMMLGPVMAVSWLVTALFAYVIFGVGVATALIIGACLSPTGGFIHFYFGYDFGIGDILEGGVSFVLPLLLQEFSVSFWGVSSSLDNSASFTPDPDLS